MLNSTTSGMKNVPASRRAKLLRNYPMAEFTMYNNLNRSIHFVFTRNHTGLGEHRQVLLSEKSSRCTAPSNYMHHL